MYLGHPQQNPNRTHLYNIPFNCKNKKGTFVVDTHTHAHALSTAPHLTQLRQHETTGILTPSQKYRVAAQTQQQVPLTFAARINPTEKQNRRDLGATEKSAMIRKTLPRQEIESQRWHLTIQFNEPVSLSKVTRTYSVPQLNHVPTTPASIRTLYAS